MIHKIKLADDKYTVIFDDSGKEPLRAERYGEPWRDLTGDKLIWCMAWRIAELQGDIKDD